MALGLPLGVNAGRSVGTSLEVVLGPALGPALGLALGPSLGWFLGALLLCCWDYANLVAATGTGGRWPLAPSCSSREVETRNDRFSWEGLRVGNVIFLGQFGVGSEIMSCVLRGAGRCIIRPPPEERPGFIRRYSVFSTFSIRQVANAHFEQAAPNAIHRASSTVLVPPHPRVAFGSKRLLPDPLSAGCQWLPGRLFVLAGPHNSPAQQEGTPAATPSWLPSINTPFAPSSLEPRLVWPPFLRKQ